MQKIIKVNDLSTDLKDVLSGIKHDKLFVLTDNNTERLCFPLISELEEVRNAGKIIIKSGDENKNLESLTYIWTYLTEHGATRHSLLINLGGGLISDIGGFAAATFKRGIKCINIPTTILGAVDAAVGGKTSINFNGLKNEIGAFAAADTVLVDSDFFKSLDHANFMSGYAEILKHALISDEKTVNKIIAFDTQNIDYDKLTEIVAESIYIKEDIVQKDPYEKDIRKALNLGHTIGHAFESQSYIIKSPIQHGYAVAWGLVCELYLSYKKCYFPKEILQKVIHFIKDNYGICNINCDEYDAYYELMKHDKKNATRDNINFTLLNDVGSVVLNQTATKEEIFESIDFLRESMGV